MAIWIKVIVVIVGLVIVGLGSVIWIGSGRWSDSPIRLSRLMEFTDSEASRVFRLKELEGLPAPVARYFRLVLKEEQPIVSSVRLVQKGKFRMGESDDGWKRLKATQYFSAGLPGFVWDARIHMAPLMTVWVRDAYVGGEASMKARLLSIVTVLDEHGKAELNAGALQRYLAEAGST